MYHPLAISPPLDIDCSPSTVGARMLNRYFKELLQLFLEEDVRFLLVGGYALGAHGYPRATKGMEVLVGAQKDNAARVMRALNRFGVAMKDVTEMDFLSDKVTYRIGVAPQRVDIMTGIRGVSFQDAYQHRVTVIVEGIELQVLSLEDLITNKLASGRPQDLLDADTLKHGPPKLAISGSGLSI